MMKYKKLSLVVPVYNEEKTLKKLLDILLSLKLTIEKEVILLDDGSTDRSRSIMKEYAKRKEVSIYFNKKNLGKSQTVKKGIGKTTGDLVVVQDADLEYDPTELEEFVQLFLNKPVDVVYGNRFGKKNTTIYPVLWIGNTFLSMVSNFFTFIRARMWIRDMEVCYKMIRGDVFRDIAKTIESTSTFGLEPEVTTKMSKYKKNGKRLRFVQIPISYHPRRFDEGKKMAPIKDGLKAFIEIIKFNIFR